MNFENLDKKYVYVLKLISNKFIRFCSYSRFNKYDYVFFIKKINRENDEIVYVDDQHIFSRFIDIIDYKTSNIDDEEYNVQVRTYMDYIVRTFNKPTNGYLYSLRKGIYKKI